MSVKRVATVLRTGLYVLENNGKENISLLTKILPANKITTDVDTSKWSAGNIRIRKRRRQKFEKEPRRNLLCSIFGRTFLTKLMDSLRLSKFWTKMLETKVLAALNNSLIVKGSGNAIWGSRTPERSNPMSGGLCEHLYKNGQNILVFVVNAATHINSYCFYKMKWDLKLGN